MEDYLASIAASLSTLNPEPWNKLINEYLFSVWWTYGPQGEIILFWQKRQSEKNSYGVEVVGKYITSATLRAAELYAEYQDEKALNCTEDMNHSEIPY